LNSSSSPRTRKLELIVRRLRESQNPRTRMAAVAPVGGADDEKRRLQLRRVTVAAAAAMEVFDKPIVKPVKPYEYKPDCSAQLDALWNDRAERSQYVIKCRLTQDETLKLLGRMGYPEPQVNDGRFKYSPLHRFIIYLMCMARHKAFEDLAIDVGYAVDSLENNINYWTALIIKTLQSDSRTSLAPHRFVFAGT
jgi:hypothetical protein